MKLIYCRECHDVVKILKTKWRKCSCGKSGAQYNDDFMSATVGGACDVIGIPNPFFDEVFKHLSDPWGKEWYRNKHGYNTTDCWYGEYPDDRQVIRIASEKGPRINIVEVIKKDENDMVLIIEDDREYKCSSLENPAMIVLTDCWNFYKQCIDQNVQKPYLDTDSKNKKNTRNGKAKS